MCGINKSRHLYRNTLYVLVYGSKDRLMENIQEEGFDEEGDCGKGTATE